MSYFFLDVLRRFPLYLSTRYLFNRHRFLRIAYEMLLLVPSLLYYLYKTIQMSFYLKIQKGIALCLICKNEGNYILEYICYYKLIGITHIYLYDNMSDDNIRFLVEPFINEGFLTYSFIKGDSRQRDVYNIYMNKYGFKYKYSAFFDTDEFLRIRSNNAFDDINDIFNNLKEKRIGCLGLYLWLFGPSGFKTKPNGLVMESYRYRCSFDNNDNEMLKNICLNKAVVSITSPHQCSLKKGYHCVNENGIIINYNNKSKTASFDNIFINHYYSKSIEEYLNRKMKLGDAYNGTLSKERPFWDVKKLIDSATYYDYDLEKYVAPTKKEIEKYNG